MEDMLKKIDDAILNYEHDEVVGTCRKALDSGNSPEEVFTSLVEGVRKITKMYQEDDYYLPDFYNGSGDLRRRHGLFAYNASEKREWCHRCRDRKRERP